MLKVPVPEDLVPLVTNDVMRRMGDAVAAVLNELDDPRLKEIQP